MSLLDKKSQWQNQGKEPDYRFSLANERTFLAWIRTSLAVLAAASFLNQFGYGVGKNDFSQFVSILLAVLAAVISFVAYVRWRNNEISMRHDLPLNGGMSLIFLVIFTCCLAVGLCIYILK